MKFLPAATRQFMYLFYINRNIPVLLFIFVEHFDMIDAVEHDEFNLLVLNDVLYDDVVCLAD